MKLQGPMFSLGASGSIGGTITFATWKGRPYARQLVIPSNPQSVQQTAFRGMFRFLSQAWGGLVTGDQTIWQDLATQGNYSTFNAFMKYNQDRWSRALPPTVDPTDPDGATAITVTPVATAGVKSVSLSLTPSAATDLWGFVIYRKEGSAPAGLFTEVIDVTPYIATPTVWNDLDVTPGIAYHYKVKAFIKHGAFGAISADVNGTPT